MYQFQSLGEFRALLSLYNMGVEKVEGDNQGHKYTGLVYSALDTNGNRVATKIFPVREVLWYRGIGAGDEAIGRRNQNQ